MNPYQQAIAQSLINSQASITMMIIKKKKEKKDRKYWVHPYYRERGETGAYVVVVESLLITDPTMFHEYMRMSPTQFESLCDLVGPLIEKQETFFRKPISGHERLAVTLRYLVSGEDYSSLAFYFKISNSAITEIVRETLYYLVKTLMPLVFPELNANYWYNVSLGFEKWNFPNCIGAIDGRHMRMECPPKAGSLFYNYKKFHSSNMLAISNHKYQFSWLDVGAAGRQSDGGVFKATEFGKLFYANKLSLPSPSDLNPWTKKVPYMLVTDDAFSLTLHSMKPYSKENLTDVEKIFNYRLSRARRVVENLFGIFVAKFRLFRNSLKGDFETSKMAIMAAACLHNLLVGYDSDAESNDEMYLPEGYVDHYDVEGNLVLGEWRKNGGHENCVPIEKAFEHELTPNSDPKSLRDMLADFFFSPEGEVPWQWKEL